MATEETVMTSAQAINDGLREIGKSSQEALLFGEGVVDPSAVYGTHKDLLPIYGRDRVIEMPVAENGLCGVAIGAALAGKRPILVFHRVEFALLAMEQIVNNAAKTHYISCGHHCVPLVIRMVIGRGWGQGPEHSQSLETLFSYIPGLKVCMPVFPRDYKGMLIAAFEDNNPVVMIEHRWTHYLKGKVPAGYYKEDIERPRKIRHGNQCTIVATSYSVVEALKAVEFLNQHGVTVDLFDLRVLSPLQLDEVIASVQKTGRLLTVDTGYKKFGIGAEIVAEVVAAGLPSLKEAPQRIGFPNHPSPSSRGYHQDLYPSASKICEQILAWVGGRSDLTREFNKIFRYELVDSPDPAFQGPF